TKRLPVVPPCKWQRCPAARISRSRLPLQSDDSELRSEMIHSRRTFMRGLPGLGAAPAVWSAFSGSLQAAAKAATPDPLWELVSRQFPLEDGLTYLNAANVCPASRLVM